MAQGGGECVGAGRRGAGEPVAGFARHQSHALGDARRSNDGERPPPLRCERAPGACPQRRRGKPQGTPRRTRGARPPVCLENGQRSARAADRRCLRRRRRRLVARCRGFLAVAGEGVFCSRRGPRRCGRRDGCRAAGKPVGGGFWRLGAFYCQRSRCALGLGGGGGLSG